MDLPPGFKPATAPPGFVSEGGSSRPLTDVHDSVIQQSEEAYPTGDYQEHGDQTEATSLGEDFRRVHEYVSSLPGKVAAAIPGAVAGALDLPVQGIVRQAMTGQDVNLGNVLSQQGFKAPAPPNFEHQPTKLNVPGIPNEPRGNVASQAYQEAPPLDVQVTGGATARQLLNKSVDLTLGRSERFLQRTIGKPLAQSMLWASKAGASLLDEEPNIKAMKAAGILAPTASAADDYGARQWLTVLAGDSFNHEPGSPEEKAYNDRLVETYGPGAANLYKMGVSLGKQWPVFFLPGAEGKFATSLEDIALKQAGELGPVALRKALPEITSAVRSQALKQNLAAGAVQSGYMAAANKEDFLQSLEEGSVVGGLLGLLHIPLAERSFAKSLSRGTGTLLPAKTMAALQNELDTAISRSRPAWRTPGLSGEAKYTLNGANGMRSVEKGGSPTTDARKALEGQMFADQLGPGQYDFDLQEGGVRHPTFSAEAVDANGQLVMRDYEIVSGPGRAPKNAPSTTVVERKGAAGQREVVPSASASSTNVTVRYRDTPIKDTEALRRLSFQPGRMVRPAAASDEVAAMTTQLVKNTPAPESKDFLWGTPDYMAPEEILKQAPEHVFRSASPEDLPASSLAGPKTGAERPKVIDRQAPTGAPKGPMVMTVRKNGGIKLTPLDPKLRPVNTRDFHPGDFVRIDHPESGFGTTVEGITAEGDVLVRDPVGKLKVEPKGRVFLSQDMAVERARLGQDAALQAGAGRGVPQGPNGRLEAIILANKNVTPLDVLAWDKRPATDLAWATNVLDDMAIDGKLKETSPGHWEAVKRKGPISKDIDAARANGGQMVYYAKGGAKGQWGVLRGPDTRTKGNWLVEVPDVGAGTTTHPIAGEVYKKTAYLSVPESDVRTKWPVLMADKAKVNPGIDAYGWTKPMPPSLIAKEPLDEVEKMSQAWSRIAPSSFTGAVNAKGDALWQTLVGAMHQADPGIRTSSAQRGFSARGVMRSEAMHLNQFLEDKLGRGSQANKELAVILEQHRARSPSGVSQGVDPALLQNWATKYPKEAAASIKDVQAMVSQLDQQSARLAELGVGNIQDLETARAGDKVPEYLTTNYAAFQMPRKEWATFARKNLTQEWHSALGYMQKVRSDLSGSGVADELEQILRLENPVKGFEDRGFIKAEAKAKLGAKKNVPPAIADILGQHKDASMKLAFSLAYQRSLIKHVEAFEAIASQPDLWSPGKRADMTLRVPDNALYGSAANGYVNDNAATRHLIEGAKAGSMGDAHAGLRAIGWMGQKWKTAHTVYNQASWVANVARNLKGIMLSPFDGEAYKEGATMLADYHRDPTAYGPNKLLIEAQDFDAVGPGLAGAELGAEQRKFQRRVFETFKAGKSGFLDTLADLRDHAMSVPESVHKGYDAIDKTAKFGSYIAWKRDFMVKGLSNDDAAAMAALRVNELFPNYTSHSTPEWATNALQGKAGGLWAGLGPWATSKLQDTRVNGNIVKNLLGATMPPEMRPKYYDPTMWWRMMRLSAMVGGMATVVLNTRRMNGISDAQDMLERSQLPIKSQKYSHLLLGSLDYDEHGRRTFYPMDTFEDLAMTLSGNMGDHPLARSALNNLLDVVGPDTMQGQAMQSMAAQAGVITPQEAPRNPRADQTGLLNTALKYGPQVLPQAPFKAAQAYNATDPSGRMVNPEALTPDQGILQGLGVKQMVVGPQTHTQTMMETAHNAKARGFDVQSAATDAALHGESRQRTKYMIESNVRALKNSINTPRPLKQGPTGGSK